MTGELLSVKEYAARQGMTEQAAYKQIRTGKILSVERQENGKPKKYVFVLSQEDQDIDAGSPEQIQPPALDPDAATAAEDLHKGPATEKEPAEDPTGAALEKAVAALTAQLEEKDRQIREKDGQINRFTELLSQSQQLQAHSQKLLEQGAQQQEPMPVQEPEEPKPEPAPQEEPEPIKKKRSFWEWLSQL